MQRGKNGMDFILMDIKNFLKKLESGQLEIEAGQWELHKDITNMRKMVNELKNLKEEMGKVRMSSLQQMGLIKELQDKFEVFRTNNGEMLFSSGLGSQESFKEHREPETGDEEFEVEKYQLGQSDEMLDIASDCSVPKSDVGNEDSELGLLGTRGVDEDEMEFAINRMGNSLSAASDNFYENKRAKSTLMAKTSDGLPSQHYLGSSTNQDILQRYLKDSAKYLGRDTTGSTIIRPSNASACENDLPDDGCPSFECDECSSVVPPGSASDSRYSKLKEWKDRVCRPSRQSRLARTARGFPKRSRKWSNKVANRRHKRKQRIADRSVFCKTCGKDFSNRYRLKKHATIHWVSSPKPKGFKCSYCKKNCSTPGKLTQHLRKCRIITRPYKRMR